MDEEKSLAFRRFSKAAKHGNALYSLTQWGQPEHALGCIIWEAAWAGMGANDAALVERSLQRIERDIAEIRAILPKAD